MSRNIKKIKFRKGDALRALLTDTLPYEVPLLFSNSGYYQRLTEKADEALKNTCQLDFFPSKKWTIPYTYNIKKDSLDVRSLSVAHPAIQRDFCLFYGEYNQLIVGLCSRSEFTLRRPVKVATHYYEKVRASKYVGNDGGVEVEANGFSEQGKHASSYFSYQRYNLIHKFYESPEFHGLEKKFRILRRLDISKCFNHIYTHSISWAAKNKKFGKDNQSDNTFEGRFDKLMQFANYNETNGIVVGPEFSRLFAEIILQSCDAAIQLSLHSNGVILGEHYQIRRYVDDYFVFVNDERTADAIQTTLSRQLAKFKLYLNEVKTSTQRRPFVTGQTGAKIEVATLVDEMFAQHTRSAGEMRKELAEYAKLVEARTVGKKLTPFAIKYVGNPTTLAAGYIRDVKQIVSRHGTDFDSISNYFFTVAVRKLTQLVERIDVDTTTGKGFERLTRFIRVVLEVVFFVYAMSPRVRATYQVSALCFSLSEFSSLLPTDAREYLKGFMAEQMRSILREAVDGGEGDNVEIVNLLAVLRSFGEDYLLSDLELLRIYGIQLDPTNSLRYGRSPFGYFQIVTILHYMGNVPRYASIHDAVCEHVQERFDAEVDFSGVQQSTELTMLALDFMRCPYVSQARKEFLALTLLRKTSPDDLKNRLAIIMRIMSTGDWFFAWEMADSIGKLLWKKELRTAY